MADIIVAVDEPLDATQCGGKQNCHDKHRCMTHDLWTNLNNKMYEYLHSVSLGDLVKQQEQKSDEHVVIDRRGSMVVGDGRPAVTA